MNKNQKEMVNAGVNVIKSATERVIKEDNFPKKCENCNNPKFHTSNWYPRNKCFWCGKINKN